MRPGSFFLFFRVLYVRSLQTVHASAITGRFSAFATWFGSSSSTPGPPVGGHAKLGAGHRGKASAFYFSSASIVNAPVPFDTDAGDSAIHPQRA